MRKLILALSILSMGGIVFLYGGYSSALRYALNPESSAQIVIDIPQGATGAQVGGILAKNNLIQSVPAFSFYLRQKGLSDKLKAGRFTLEENFTLPKIVDALAEGRSSEFAVTLLEGWTARQMAEELEKEGLTTVEAFMKCLSSCEFEGNFLPTDHLEGYLYPDTYFVNPADYSDRAFIARLVTNFKNKLNQEDWAAINASQRNLSDIIKMASIVEREERNEAERPMVAAILWNRLDAGMGLGADATVLYGLDRTSGSLTQKNLDSDSPYNTRKFTGLPPTPISNPSVSSIRAALYPKKTEYFYYLHDSEGSIHYAQTLKGHNANKAKYL